MSMTEVVEESLKADARFRHLTVMPEVNEMGNEWINPEWPDKKFKYIHDWRRYIGQDMRDSWDTFTEHQKRILFENAQIIADGEDWE